ncbi:toll/interleukin-1 receptor domain-containing protein [Corallococcus exercitus]|uniref:Toll/interleukin-1 receptor domain-containing protein n=1 Tax=Corallococcus exercitus TaxID=2316736 RepID=A0A7Y4KHS4_9BACT|nr:toll/interleukin-1 receptor domain-containing protein [Corallococcus exercitus]
MHHHPVFISYARNVSRAHAEALHHALSQNGMGAFLDTEDIREGEPWPKHLAEALLAARVVVVFAEDGYFERLSCWRELQAALAPFRATHRSDALGGIVVARPVGSTTGMEALPPALRSIQWPRADDVPGLVERVRSGLAVWQESFGARLDALGALQSRTSLQLVEELAAEPPHPLDGQIPQYPLQLAPSLGRTFVGRADELWRMDLVLRARDPHPAPRTVALHGGGGTGKTRLALEYLHRHGRHFSGGVFWIDADASTERLEEQLHGVLRALRPEVPPLAQLRKEQRSVSDALAQALRAVPPEKPILYIVDNLPEPEGAQRPRPLQDWCPGVGRVSLLVTSRLRPATSGVTVQSVEPLHPESAMLMLTHDHTVSALGEEDWLRITRWVGHLPLALELLNRAIHLGGLTPEELLQKARHERPARELDRQMDALRDQVEPDALRGVTEAFALSYERLPERARKAARLLARLGPEPIPLMLLEALGPEVAAQDLRTALVTRAIVSKVPGREVPLFGRMHRLLADFLLGQSIDPDGELRQVGYAVHKVVTPDDRHNVLKWPVLQAWIPHAEAVYEALCQRDSRVDIRLEVQLGLLMSSFLIEQGALGQAKQVCLNVLARGTVFLGPHDSDVLSVVNCLAVVHQHLGETGVAMKHLQQLLAVSRSVLGDNDPETLTVMGNLASTLMTVGFTDEALTLKEDAVQHWLAMHGPEAPETLAAMNNLAVALFDVGEGERALAMHEDVCRISLKVLGPDHSETHLAMLNLAECRLSMGRVDEARSALDGLLVRLERSHSDLHPTKLSARSALAMSLARQGDIAGARGHAEAVLRFRSQALGIDHPETLASCWILADLLEMDGDWQGSRRLKQQRLELCRERYGEGHKETFDATLDLVETLKRSGLPKDALELLGHYLEALLRLHGEDFSGTLTTMALMAQHSRAEGVLSRARQWSERSLAGWGRIVGPEDFQTTAAAWEHFQLLVQLGEVEASQAILEHHLQWMQWRPAESLHPIQQEIQNWLFEEGRFSKTAPKPEEEPSAVPLNALEGILAAPVFEAPKAGIQLYFLGDPIEPGEAYEQIRSFLLGKLLTRGIRKGEAAARLERRSKVYRVEFDLRQGNDAEALGTLTIPHDGFPPKDFESKLKAARITTVEDPNIMVVTKRVLVSQ